MPSSITRRTSGEMDSIGLQHIVTRYSNDFGRPDNGVPLRRIDSSRQTRTTRKRQPPPRLGRISRGIIRNRAKIWSLAPTLAALCWLTMLIYFMVYYLTLPRYDGILPRMNRSYATIPYVSSIGEELVTAFRGFSITVALCNIAAFSLDVYLCRRIIPARSWRYAKTGSAWISSIFLVLLSFYGVEENTNLHLAFTSISIIATGVTRFCDWIQTRILLPYSPGNRYILGPYFWKQVAACIAARK